MSSNAFARVLGAAAAVAAPAVAPAEAKTPTTAPKLRVAARQHVLYGSRAPVTGTLTSGASNRRVLVQLSGGHGWKTVARTRTHSHGRFRVMWRGRQLGRYRMRVRAPGTGAPPRRVRGKVIVYRSVAASWYGPGLYGNRLACGGTLTPGTAGVANRTLPCGTRVTLRYRGRTATVRVIDRGPYAAGRTYDLTAATRNKLHFGSTGNVWSSK